MKKPTDVDEHLREMTAAVLESTDGLDTYAAGAPAFANLMVLSSLFAAASRVLRGMAVAATQQERFEPASRPQLVKFPRKAAKKRRRR